ncbi:Fc receptor-like protein 3 [Sardina pilchardus]|uniref:Fc receptor-like protein 3 n=1 Tax=Sardina pilchardus TaxID=27697 RepID=UPI002E0E10D1
MELSPLGLLLLVLILCSYSGHAADPPIVTVSSHPPLYPGERVTLRCDMSGYTDWVQYVWYKDNNQFNHNRQTLTITLPGYAGQYTCKGRRSGWQQYTQRSAPVSISVTDLPVATVAVESPQPPFYPGDKVTLRCDIAEHTYYYWYKDNLFKENKKTLTIPLPDHAGQYTCEGYRSDRKLYSQRSAPVSISVTALPTAKLTVEPQSPVFTGETVTLECVIESLGGWTYKWYKESSRTPVSEENTFTIRGAAESHKGQYWCQGERRHRPTASHPSRRITLDVKALPTATLTVEPQSPVFTGETVTLTCVIESLGGWTYKWYKESSRTPVSEENTFTIRGAAESHKGQYWCQGERRHRPTSSQPSWRTTLDVKASKPKLTLSPDRQLLTGDSVTLRCELGVSSGLVFYWYRDTQTSDPVNQTDGDSYSISSVNISDGGQYWCRAGRGDPDFYTQYSDAAEITVTDAGSSKSMVTVGVVIRLLLAFALMILMVVLMHCSQKAKGSVLVTPNPGLQQSDSHSPTSQNRVLGGAVAGTSDVVYDEIELKDTL